MSQFATDFAAGALAGLMETHGDSVTYTPATGDAVALTAILGPEMTEESPTLDGRELRITRNCTIGRDPDADAGGVADPATNASVTVGTTTYAVEAIDEQDAASATLRLVRRPAVEKTRPNYRRKT